MKKTLKWIAGGIASLLLLAIACVLVLLAFPQVLINDHYLNVASRLANRSGVEISWDHGQVSVKSVSFLEKRLQFEFSRLCVRMQNEGFNGCIDKARFAVAGGLKGFKPRVTELGPVDVRGARLTYISSEVTAPRPEEKQVPDKKSGDLVSSYLADARLLPLHIEVASWVVGKGPTQMTGDLLLNGSGPIPKLQALAGLQSTDGTNLKMDVRLESTPGIGQMAFTYSAVADYRKNRAKATMSVRGEASPDRWAAMLTAKAERLFPGLRQVWINDCELKLERTRSDARPSNIKVNCPLEALIPVPPKGFPPLAVPAKAGVRVVADLDSTAFPPSAESSVEGKVSVELSPLLTPIFQGGGTIQSKLAGIPKNFPHDWKMDTDLGLKLKVSNFERLVQNLARTPFAVWAPFRAFKGQVDLDIQGKFDANAGDVPIRFQTRLTSEKQRFNLDSTGRIQVTDIRTSPRAHLALDVLLSDVLLELPPLPSLPSPLKPKPDSMPQFLPDSRIQASATSRQRQMGGKKPSPLTYEVRIHTPDPQHPVRLLSTEFKAPIPVAVEVTLSNDSPIKGGIKVMTFPLELFRRQVTLEHLTLTLLSPSKGSTLDGRFHVPYTDYTITILMLGTLDKPQLKFMSDPPLPEDQIIAVLIFGQSLDALDPDQQESVGNSRAALREGAMSLFSLYYLSSLNIERIDYDPGTQTASVRYRLAEGTSLNVSEGPGGGQPSIGVRKRLNKHFAITTTLNNRSEQQTEQTVSTFLEWAYQY